MPGEENQIKVSIKGMHCGNCTYKIECEIGDLKGVEDVKVDLKSESGTFKFNPASITSDEIVKKIGDLGFKAQLVMK